MFDAAAFLYSTAYIVAGGGGVGEGDVDKNDELY